MANHFGEDKTVEIQELTDRSNCGVKLLIHHSEIRTYTKEVLSLCCVLKNIKCNDITNVRQCIWIILSPLVVF